MLDKSITRRKFSDKLPSCIYYTALILLLVLSEIFSSNIQEALPAFSHFARIALTGSAALLLLIKLSLFNTYAAHWQSVAVLAAVLYSGVVSVYADDTWFVLAVLCGFAAKGVDLKGALKVYLATAVVCLLLVQLLHFATPFVPYRFYCRNWDFGYGHYNGYAARLLGVFLAWGWLRSGKMRIVDWLGLSALMVYTLVVPGARGAGLAMLLFLLLSVFWLLLPRFFTSKIFFTLSILAYPLVMLMSLAAGWLFNPNEPQRTPLLAKVNQLLSGRFEIWNHVFWGNSYTHPAEDGAAAWLHDAMPNVRTLFGGFPTEGDVHHAIDNAFLATIMNKGYLGAAILSICLLFLVFRLCKRRCTDELICLVVVFAYLFMENKPFLISASPMFLLLPVLLAPKGSDLPTLKPTA